MPLVSPQSIDDIGSGQSSIGNQAQIAAPVILQFWQLFLRWKWVALGIIFSAVIIGLVATLLTTPKYTAKVRIEISRDQKNITKVDGVESPNSGRDLEFYQTQYALLQARSLAERVARQLRLANDERFFAAHGASANGKGGLLNSTAENATVAQREKREKLAVDVLLGSVSVSPIRNSALIDVSYTSANPAVSAQIANAWTEQFVAASMDRRFASTADARQFLEKRLTELRARLEQSERDLVNYAAEKNIVSLSRTQGADGKTQTERTLISADLEALNLALVEATADRISAESRARTGANKEAKDDPLLVGGGTSQLRQKRAEIAAEYAKLMVQFEPGYPAARALSEQLKVLDSSIAREESRVKGLESGRSSTNRTSEYRAAARREQELKQKVDVLKSQFDDQQKDSIQYNIYQREADTNRQLYDALLQRYKEIGVAGVGASNVAVVDNARVPQGPSSPNLQLNLALALLIGLGLAGLAIFALDQIDEGLREPSQVNRELNVPLLGSVPDVDEDPAILLNDPKSALSEAYLSIRSNLAFSTDHGVPRSLMVTSTRPAEGKSTTSLALASVLARTGKKVLLIDADMRSPSIHQIMGKQNIEGLSNFLAGDNEWKAMVHGSANGLPSLLPAGPTPPSAAELLSSDRMMMLVRQALEFGFDNVVIDSPPILGLADAPLLSRAVEGCIFVVEVEGVAVRGIKSSLSRLQSVQAHIFGVVLTKLQSKQIGYGYGYDYGYGADRDATAKNS